MHALIADFRRLNASLTSSISNNIPVNSVEVKLWGTGKVYREFMHVDDMSKKCISIMQNIEANKLYDYFKISHINIGTGEDITIAELSELIKKIVGFSGKIKWDMKNIEGTKRKKLDISILNKINTLINISLKKGVKEVYANYQEQ